MSSTRESVVAGRRSEAGAPTPEPQSPAVKEYREGTHRIVSPDVTLQRMMPHAASCGITRVANITGLDVIGIPVWVAFRPNSRSLSVSQGKGLDDAAAKASAVMESIEAFHAERILRPVKLATEPDMRAAHTVADVKDLPRTARIFDAGAVLPWIEA